MTFPMPHRSDTGLGQNSVVLRPILPQSLPLNQSVINVMASLPRQGCHVRRLILPLAESSLPPPLAQQDHLATLVRAQ